MFNSYVDNYKKIYLLDTTQRYIMFSLCASCRMFSIDTSLEHDTKMCEPRVDQYVSINNGTVTENELVPADPRNNGTVT